MTKAQSKKPQRYLNCFGLWQQPVVNWDGRFVGCTARANNDFGLPNVFEVGLEKILESDIIKKTKKMLMGGPICEASPCSKCTIYRQMCRDKNFISADEVMLN